MASSTTQGYKGATCISVFQMHLIIDLLSSFSERPPGKLRLEYLGYLKIQSLPHSHWNQMILGNTTHLELRVDDAS